MTLIHGQHRVSCINAQVSAEAIDYWLGRIVNDGTRPPDCPVAMYVSTCGRYIGFRASRHGPSNDAITRATCSELDLWTSWARIP